MATMRTSKLSDVRHTTKHSVLADTRRVLDERPHDTERVLAFCRLAGTCLEGELATEYLNFGLLWPVLYSVIFDNDVGLGALWEAGAAALVLSCLIRAEFRKEPEGQSQLASLLVHEWGILPPLLQLLQRCELKEGQFFRLPNPSSAAADLIAALLESGEESIHRRFVQLDGPGQLTDALHSFPGTDLYAASALRALCMGPLGVESVTNIPGLVTSLCACLKLNEETPSRFSVTSYRRLPLVLKTLELLALLLECTGIEDMESETREGIRLRTGSRYWDPSLARKISAERHVSNLIAEAMRAGAKETLLKLASIDGKVSSLAKAVLTALEIRASKTETSGFEQPEDDRGGKPESL